MNIQHPDEIIGDLDSVDPTVLAFYKQFSKVKVTPTPDQDYTDFTKGKLFALPNYNIELGNANFRRCFKPSSH